MKKIFLLLVSVVLLGCSSDSDSNDNPETACGTATITNVSQNFETLTVSWQSQGNFNYFEIGYDASGNLNGQVNSNTTFNYSFTSTNNSIATEVLDAESINFFVQENETFSFYIRAQCVNGQFTDWQGPFVLQLNEVCSKPENLNVFGDELDWEFNSFSINASYFQVEYGLQGFSTGTGTQITTNDEYVVGLAMEQGNIYDFYVRAFCENNVGWSDWAGPVSYFADQDYNLCNPPSNVQYFIEYITGSSAGVRFEWDYNGETQFEHVLVSNNGNPDNGTISSSDTFGWPVYTGLSTFADYDFYVRGVCNDGTRTVWVGPLNVNP
ncbi:MAG: hypothetical protein GYB35_13645 [Algicola sp.]|nr:hypothetical protein [Algicola sp.]